MLSYVLDTYLEEFAVMLCCGYFDAQQLHINLCW
mgnify:CR=1 FL=1